MNALRLKDNAFIKLGKTVFDENGNEYSWQELQICPSDWAEVYVGPSQKELRLLREKFAGLAMQAILSNSNREVLGIFKTQADIEQKDIRQIVARSAVELADALVEELRKSKEE